MVILMGKEVGYLAGFLDGEGNISANLKTVWLRFSNTNLKVLQWIHSKIKVGKIVPAKHKVNNPKHKLPYVLTVHGNEAKEVLREILACSIIKKKQAKLAISYPIGTQISYIKLTSSILKKRREIINKIHILNRRGNIT